MRTRLWYLVCAALVACSNPTDVSQVTARSQAVNNKTSFSYACSGLTCTFDRTTQDGTVFEWQWVTADSATGQYTGFTFYAQIDPWVNTFPKAGVYKVVLNDAHKVKVPTGGYPDVTSAVKYVTVN